jgi:hypothetical protein
MRAAMNPLHMAPGHRSAIAYGRFVIGPRRSLLLQPRVISRRRRHGRRRGACRHHKGPAAEGHKRSNGKAWIKSLHVVFPGTVAAQLRTAAWPKFALDRRRFKASVQAAILGPDLVRRQAR